MSYELEYFTEFLEDPSAVSIAEFYRMVKAWAQYIGAHKADFNYLEDDEWKEIRERLIDEFQVREEIKDEIEAEWEEICSYEDVYEELSDDEAVKLMHRQLNFMKTHQEFYQFTDEAIETGETGLKKLEKSMKKVLIAEEQLRISELELDKSLADLDEALIKAQKRTGKTPHVHFYKGAKRYMGN